MEKAINSDSTRNFVEISTIGHDGKSKKRVTKKAHYSDRIWAATNPNFLLSGQVCVVQCSAKLNAPPATI